MSLQSMQESLSNMSTWLSTSTAQEGDLERGDPQNGDTSTDSMVSYFKSQWSSLEQQASSVTAEALAKARESFQSEELSKAFDMSELNNFSRQASSSFRESMNTMNSSLEYQMQSATTSLSNVGEQISKVDMSKQLADASARASQSFNDMGNSMQLGMNEFGGVMNTGFNSLATEMNKAGSSVAGQLNEGMNALQQFDQQRLMTFGALLAGSAFFMVLALWIGLPTLALAPAKFAICFTMGSALNMGAFAALRGPMAQAKHMIHKDRLPFSAAYVSSMLATLYAAMYMHSYVLTVIFSAIQIMCLGYYLASYFPGGVAGLKVLTHFLSATLGPLLKATGRCFGVMFRACLR